MKEDTLLCTAQELTRDYLASKLMFYGEGEAEYAAELLISRFEVSPWANYFKWDSAEGKLYKGQAYNPNMIPEETYQERYDYHVDYMNDFPAIVTTYSKLLPRRKHGFVTYFAKRLNKDYEQAERNPRRRLESMINHMCQMKAYNRLSLMDDSFDNWLNQGILEVQKELFYARGGNRLNPDLALYHVQDMMEIINEDVLRVIEQPGIRLKKPVVPERAILDKYHRTLEKEKQGITDEPERNPRDYKFYWADGFWR